MQDVIVVPSTPDESSQKKQVAIVVPDCGAIDALFLQTWLHGKSEKTKRAYLADIIKLYEYTGVSLQQMTLLDFQGYVDSLVRLKPSTQARMIASVKSALSFACKTGYIQFNVGAVVKLPKFENTLAERIISEEQVVRMFALEKNKRNHAILVLLYRAGLRASEVCNLQWRHLTERDGNTGQVAIFGKGKKTRFILLDKKTWQEIQSLKKGSEQVLDSYVFQSRKTTVYVDEQKKQIFSRRLDESCIHRIVKNAAMRADVATYETEQGTTSKTSPHWMRHAHATHSLERGAPITLVRDTLGHSSMETTAKYTHARPNSSSTQFLGV